MMKRSEQRPDSMQSEFHPELLETIEISDGFSVRQRDILRKMGNEIFYSITTKIEELKTLHRHPAHQPEC